MDAAGQAIQNSDVIELPGSRGYVPITLAMGGVVIGGLALAIASADDYGAFELQALGLFSAVIAGLIQIFVVAPRFARVRLAEDGLYRHLLLGWRKIAEWEDVISCQRGSFGLKLRTTAGERDIAVPSDQVDACYAAVTDRLEPRRRDYQAVGVRSRGPEPVLPAGIIMAATASRGIALPRWLDAARLVAVLGACVVIVVRGMRFGVKQAAVYMTREGLQVGSERRSRIAWDQIAAIEYDRDLIRVISAGGKILAIDATQGLSPKLAENVLRENPAATMVDVRSGEVLGGIGLSEDQLTEALERSRRCNRRQRIAKWVGIGVLTVLAAAILVSLAYQD